MTSRHRLLAALFAISASGCVNLDTDARLRSFAQLPNWTGLWIADDGVMSDLEPSGSPKQFDRSKHLLSGHAPYTAAWEPKNTAFVEAFEKRQSEGGGQYQCALYFPLIMESPWIFEFAITPEETTMVFAGREIRHVYTDGKKHLDEDSIWATPWGDSVGHWDKDTLVIDTIAVHTSPMPPGPLLSDKAHFTERIRMTTPGRLEDQITMEDPIALSRAWTVTVPYKRVTTVDRLIHGDCEENNRNPVVDGKLTIAPAH